MFKDEELKEMHDFWNKNYFNRKTLNDYFHQNCYYIKDSEFKTKPEQVVIGLQIDDSQLNSFGTLHGGSLITLFDFCTYTTAFKHLGLNKNLNYLMLSVSMQCQFFNAIQQGDTVIVVVDLVRIGKKLVFTEAKAYSKNTNQHIANYQHTKIIQQTQKKQKEKAKL